MAYESKQLSMLVSHAAHHLHAAVGNVATALLDTSENPKLLFSNSALSQVSGHELIGMARQYGEQTTNYPVLHTHQEFEPGLNLFFAVLDELHVFVVVGKPQDEIQVQEFVERLKKLLPVQRA